MFSKRAGIIALLTGALFTSFCLSACGSGGIEETTVIVKKDGSLESVIVEDFDKLFYDVGELEAMASEEAEEYNKDHGKDSVKVKRMEAIDGSRVRATMEFKSGSDYAAYNNVRFFEGTVQEAMDAGYEFTTALRSVESENETISSHDIIDERADCHVIITDEIIDIRTYSKVLYTCTGVTVISPKEVKVEEDMEGLAYIIFK